MVATHRKKAPRRMRGGEITDDDLMTPDERDDYLSDFETYQSPEQARESLRDYLAVLRQQKAAGEETEIEKRRREDEAFFAPLRAEAAALGERVRQQREAEEERARLAREEKERNHPSTATRDGDAWVVAGQRYTPGDRNAVGVYSRDDQRFFISSDGHISWWDDFCRAHRGLTAKQRTALWRKECAAESAKPAAGGAVRLMAATHRKKAARKMRGGEITDDDLMTPDERADYLTVIRSCEDPEKAQEILRDFLALLRQQKMAGEETDQERWRRGMAFKKRLGEGKGYFDGGSRAQIKQQQEADEVRLAREEKERNHPAGATPDGDAWVVAGQRYTLGDRNAVGVYNRDGRRFFISSDGHISWWDDFFHAHRDLTAKQRTALWRKECAAKLAAESAKPAAGGAVRRATKVRRAPSSTATRHSSTTTNMPRRTATSAKPRAGNAYSAFFSEHVHDFDHLEPKKRMAAVAKLYWEQKGGRPRGGAARRPAKARASTRPSRRAGSARAPRRSKSSRYKEHGIRATKAEIEHLARGGAITVRPEHAHGDQCVCLTPGQLLKIRHGMQLKMSAAQIKHNLAHGGGFWDLIKKGVGAAVKHGVPLLLKHGVPLLKEHGLKLLQKHAPAVGNAVKGLLGGSVRGRRRSSTKRPLTEYQRFVKDNARRMPGATARERLIQVAELWRSRK